MRQDSLIDLHCIVDFLNNISQANHLNKLYKLQMTFHLSQPIQNFPIPYLWPSPFNKKYNLAKRSPNQSLTNKCSNTQLLIQNLIPNNLNLKNKALKWIKNPNFSPKILLTPHPPLKKSPKLTPNHHQPNTSTTKIFKSYQLNKTICNLLKNTTKIFQKINKKKQFFKAKKRRKKKLRKFKKKIL